MLQWLITRVAVIYVLVLVFCLTCVDFKALDTRIKTRRLNDAIPDFSDMIVFSKNHDAKNGIHWKPFKDYFELILKYMPADLTSRQLLGYVDYYDGQENQAINLFKNSASIQGHDIFWPNYNLGVIYFRKQMWSQASQYLLKAIAANPKLTFIILQNSMVYKQIFANPFFKYSLGDEINEAEANAYILLLSSLGHLGQYDKMVFIANLSLSNQDFVHKDAFYYYMGVGFLQMGQLQKAVPVLEKSISIEKNDPDPYYYLATIYRQVGQAAQAKYFFELSYTLHQKNDPRFPYDNHADLLFF